MALWQVSMSDPPWYYAGRVQHNGKLTTGSATFHYPTMKPDELKALPVADWHDPEQSIHFMWVTGPQLAVGIDVLAAWGFTFKTVAFVWEKQRVNPGYYTMSSCEYVIVGVRGRIPRPRGVRNARQFLQCKAQVHSRKPREVRDRIDLMFPDQPKLELFCRDTLEPPWYGWGNELGKFRQEQER